MDPLQFIHECLRRLMDEADDSSDTPLFLKCVGYALLFFTPMSWQKFHDTSTANMRSYLQVHMVSEFTVNAPEGKGIAECVCLIMAYLDFLISFLLGNVDHRGVGTLDHQGRPIPPITAESMWDAL